MEASSDDAGTSVGDEVVCCVALSCALSARACGRRWAVAAGQVRLRIVPRGSTGHRYSWFGPCRGCPVGRENALRGQR